MSPKSINLQNKATYQIVLTLFSSDEIISVTSLNRLSRELLELGIPKVWISGEISNWMVASSGHAYFSLKDSKAQLRCVMFRQQLNSCSIKPRNGLQVEIKGLVSIYEARGDFQLNVDNMRIAGLGNMFEAYERLKIKLQAEGIFDSTNKRALVDFPRAIGVVASIKSAALRDILSALARRMPNIPIIIYPCAVQGENAAQQIAKAINTANKRREVDTLIISRGGGSMEDLWAFNEEIVARAIYKCSIPTISGVGHETDFSICDFVADQRAATPTAAAELASPDKNELSLRLTQKKQQLRRSISSLLGKKQQQLDYLARTLASPQQQISLQNEQVKTLRLRLNHAIQQTFGKQQQNLIKVESTISRLLPNIKSHQDILAQVFLRLQHAQQQNIENYQRKLTNYKSNLSALNPEAVLQRGYAIVQKENGKIIKSTAELQDKDLVLIKLAQGEVYANIDQPFLDYSDLINLDT